MKHSRTLLNFSKLLATTAALLICFALPSAGWDRGPEATLLDLPVYPIERNPIPLTAALAELGKHLNGDYVLFGVELRLRNGEEPMVNLSVGRNATLGDCLQRIIEQVPDYRFRVVGRHLINVYPAGAHEDAESMLNLKVSRFDLDKQFPLDVLGRPYDFIPELGARLTPQGTGRGPTAYFPGGLYSIGPGVTLHLRDVTVRQILNAVSEAAADNLPPNYQPAGWVYSARPDSRSPGGSVHSWAVHWSVLDNWKTHTKRSEQR